MNKKVLNVLLFGALMSGATGTFTSCKDYDDDIERLEQSIQTNADAIKKLQELVGNGQFLTGVTKSGNDLIFNVSNGTSITVASVDGKDGKDGKDGTMWTIGEDGYWYMDGTKTDVLAIGQKGEKGDKGDQGDKGDKGDQGEPGAPGAAGGAGANGLSPYIGENGNWFVYDAEGKAVDTGISTDAKNYVVKFPLYYELHMQQKDSEEPAVIKLPATAVVSSIKILDNRYYYEFTAPGLIQLNCNTATKDAEFNGKSYKKGQVLFGSGSKLLVMLNPVNADATLYDFCLFNSKGEETAFVLGDATPHMTDGPITRAATADLGLYEIPVSLKDGLSAAQIPGNTVLYAVATEDYMGNRLLSNYYVKVNAQSNSATNVFRNSAVSNQIEVGKTKNLAELFSGLDTAVDYYFTYAENQTANANKVGLQISADKKSVSATVIGTITLTIKYLKLDGNEGSRDFLVDFIPAGTTGSLSDFAWTINATDRKTTEIDVTSDLVGYITPGTEVNKRADAVITYAVASDNDKFGADAIAKGIKELWFKQTSDKLGYPKVVAWMVFDEKEIAPTTFNGELKLNGLTADVPVKTLKFTVTVKANASFDFKPKAAFFDGTHATAYTTLAGNTSTYDLYNLFDIANGDKAYVYFKETLPAPYKDKNNVNVEANRWLTGADLTTGYTQNSQISVLRKDVATHKNDGIGEARDFTVKYVPFGNDNIEPILMDFQLTPETEVLTPTYINWTKNSATGKWSYAAGNDKTVTVTNDATLKLNEILVMDVYGKGVLKGTAGDANVTVDSRVEAVSVALADANAKQYLKLDVTDLNTTSQAVTISSSSTSTAVVTAQKCKLEVTVKDAWGIKHTVPVYVMFK